MASSRARLVWRRARGEHLAMPDAPPSFRPLNLQRTVGALRLAFLNGPRGTRLETFYQQGAARARLPRVAAGEPPEAVLINTAGGLTGGDRMDADVRIGAGASATITTQAGEKIYRAGDGETTIRNRIEVGAGARLAWLPQETILFDQARLDRTLEVALAEDATVLLSEAIVFGRTAMGETVRDGLVRDRWRVRRAGELVFADGLMLHGEGDRGAGEMLARPGALDGACAMASVLFVSPHAENRLDAVRAALEPFHEGPDGEVHGGASAWNGLLAVRVVGAHGAALRRALIASLAALRDERPLPTVWSC